MNKEYTSLGCASLLGRYSKRDSINMLDHAYSEGIRHFDVARSYGYGEAETLLGRLTSKEEGVKISTKFGVLPSRNAKIFSFAKPLARSFLKKKTPDSLDINYENKNIIDEDLLTRSIETSLRELNADYVFRLYIHEPSNNWVMDDNLYQALERLKNNNIIGDWGISGYLDSVQKISQNKENNKVKNYQSSLNILNYLNLNNLKIESAFSPFHRGYVINALEELSLNKQFTEQFGQIINCDFHSKTAAYWALSLLSAVSNVKIILATRSVKSLDENIVAINEGKSIDYLLAKKIIQLIMGYVND
jgi:aryl-alcohol dehydrogenase-like predicted oxidoreductase